MKKQFVLKQSVIAVAMTLATTSVALAQQAAEAPVQKVYVTGSNIKRADKETSSPVEVLTAKQIEATGANTVQELLHSIPAFGSGASVDITDGGFSKGASTASLRGLGSSSTLVLLNGRRITASAYADPNQGKSAVYDLNSIPVTALERVEVFKDGASAVYGSDAIAGVINFITKTDYTGVDLRASYAANDNNEFMTKRVSGVAGWGDLAKDKFNVMVTWDLSKRGETNMKEVRDIAVDQYAYVNARLNPLSSSISASPFFYRERTPGARNFATSLSLAADIKNALNCPTSEQITGDAAKHNLSATSPLIGRTFCNYDIDQYSDVQAEGNDRNAMTRITKEFANGVTSFTEIGYNRSERIYLGAPLTVPSTSATTVFSLTGVPSSFQVILPVGHPDNPFPTSRAAASFRLVGHKGGSANVNETYRVLTGLRGTTGSWDWETGLLWNRSERHETYYGMRYIPVLNKIMTENRTIAATIADPNSTVDVNNNGFASVLQFDVKASTTFGKLPGGEMGMAVGAEVREEKIGLDPDANTRAGNIVGLANSSADGQRKVSSAFVEFRAPVLKSLDLDFAARVDKYPTFPTSFIPKAGFKYAALDNLTFRGSFSKGFRAPALTQVSAGGVQSFTTVTDSLRCPDGVNPKPGADRTDCSKGISSFSAATPDLKAEKSKSWSLGAIFNPTKNVDVITEWWRIRKVDESALLSAQYVIDHESLYPGRVVRDTNPANLLVDASGKPIAGTGPISQVNRSYVNQGSTDTSGIDFEITTRTNLGEAGRLTNTLNWAYLLTYKRAERPGEREANVVGTAGGISDWATSVGDIPRHRVNYSVTWTRDVHTVTGTIDFVSSVSLLRRSENQDIYAVPYCHYGTGQPSSAYQLGGLPRYNNPACTVDGWTTLGLAYGYTGFKDWKLNFNVRNLLDTKAPYDPRSATTGFNTQLHNGAGRNFRVSAAYSFK
ncbi:TonB-dependent receptor domain-containing protein [Massilia sp. TS11]|uniref:TonB-dependent receptor domain-containing protein n=1 Tax=Massilia sp. TS11 TaxID=2908003 RepID=UPI001EDA89BE|nr:TonB-dependent receptor [Massilia sp. TS11]MCG2585892.1 TonB-dependent receptor [Massilia sp. TS11]